MSKASNMASTCTVVSKHIRRNDRNIYYHITGHGNACAPIVIVFYPLGASSSLITSLVEGVEAYHGSARILCVDRPGCRGTSTTQKDDDNSSPALKRIHQSINDVYQVLEYETSCFKEVEQNCSDSPSSADVGLEQEVFPVEPIDIYVLAVCLGHPYGIAMAKSLVEDASHQYSFKGFALVSPFVCVTCPHSMGIAQFASLWVPEIALQAVGSMQSTLVPLSLSSMGQTILRRFVPETDLAQNGGEWTDADFEVCQETAVRLNRESAPATGSEISVACSQDWGPAFYSDAFNGDHILEHLRKKHPDSSVKIHACAADTTTPYQSTLWLNETCFGGNAQVVTHADVQCHELMTMWKGPSRKPLLFLQIMEDWCLTGC